MTSRLNTQWIACHWRDCLCLPEPGETWDFGDVDDPPWYSGDTPRSKGIIRRVEKSEYGQRATYETREDAWDRIQDYAAEYEGGDPGDA